MAQAGMTSPAAQGREPFISSARSSQAGTSAAARILLDDATLRAAYLLGHAQSSDPASLTDERASRFLLWFASEGWRRYPHVNFSPAYLAFLATPAPPHRTRLAAYLHLSRADLRARFGGDVASFTDWFESEGAVALGVAPLYPSRGAMASSDRGQALPGVNIIGFGESVMGIGEDVRALDAALERAGVPRVIVNVALSDAIGTSRPEALHGLRSDRPIFPVSIFALPPFETARLHLERGPALFHGRYSIGYWPWELTSLPLHWRGVFDLVDEVWASSDFLHDVYSGLTARPVTLARPYLNIPAPEPVDLSSYGVRDDDFVCLTLLDFNSFVERKNPAGAIAAFRRAFPQAGSEKLVVKAINAHGQTEAARTLFQMASEDSRCIVIDSAFSRPQVAGLLARADILISLHRAEGFGRVVAEAMALGTTVVATNWSGPTAFLDADRGYPVDFTLRDVETGEYPFHHGSRWAEPSIDDAVAKLRLARANAHRDAGKRACARSFVNGKYGLDAVAAGLRQRLGAIAQAQPHLRG